MCNYLTLVVASKSMKENSNDPAVLCFLFRQSERQTSLKLHLFHAFTQQIYVFKIYFKRTGIGKRKGNIR